MILLVNACARHKSRTLPLAKLAAQRLAKLAAQRLAENTQADVGHANTQADTGHADTMPQIVTLDLYDEPVGPLGEEQLAKRERCVAAGDFSDDMFRFAKQFAAADKIVVAAPYWDLSFPSVLKCYVEQICVNGLTFQYNEEGIPEPLCRADQLVYVMTAGGPIAGKNFGFDYIDQLCHDFFGIHETVCVSAEGLDIYGADVDGILKRAEDAVREAL